MLREECFKWRIRLMEERKYYMSVQVIKKAVESGMEITLDSLIEFNEKHRSNMI